MTFLIVGNAIVEIVPTRNADGSYVPQIPGFSIADSMAKWGLYMTYLAIAGGVFKGAEILFGALSAERFGYQLRNYLFKSIVSQEIGFFDSTSSGKLLGLIAEETSTIQQIYTTRLLAFVQNASSFIVGMILALVASWKTSLLMLAGGVPTIGLSVIITAIVVYYSSKTMNKLSASSLALANEAMGSIRTVRSMAAEDREVARFGQNLDSHARIAVIKSMILGVCAAVQQFAFWGCNAFIFYYAGQLIDKGELPQGELLHLFGYMYVAMIGLTTAATDLSHFYKANVAAHSILKVALRQPKIQNKGKILIDPKPSSIEFKRIKFAYPTRPNTFILTNFSLKIEPGEHVGVVGESGAGKSTLTALVERFYEATEGSVLIDGVNVQDIDNKCLHKHIAIVTQEPTLFNATIRENIKYAVGNDAADEQMISCAKAANCHNFIIQLPDGYDTIVGDRGVSMSGGQKQRIAIARAMMQNASILLLDEATSALDTESEQLVQEALNELMANKTTLIIAHRLTAVQDCDRICVMANGDIVEEGTHEELIAKQGIYTSLAKKQIENT
jgi:ATP-binding cassette subfamily B (MDR/TAP) protein 1